MLARSRTRRLTNSRTWRPTNNGAKQQQHKVQKQQGPDTNQWSQNPNPNTKHVKKSNPQIQNNDVARQQLDTSHQVKPNNMSNVGPNHPNQINAVQANKKNVQRVEPRHRDFHARPNTNVASVQYNQNYRIRNAENWQGQNYAVFRNYRPQWHERSWWHSHHNHIVLIGGGYYFWNAGYWYPAWGYDSGAAYYPYDGPIYVGSNARPFDQVVADVQSVLQEQGYYRGEVDGLVGPLTQEALAAYQSAQGLEQTAAIDEPTLDSLGLA